MNDITNNNNDTNTNTNLDDPDAKVILNVPASTRDPLHPTRDFQQRELAEIPTYGLELKELSRRMPYQPSSHSTLFGSGDRNLQGPRTLNFDPRVTVWGNISQRVDQAHQSDYLDNARWTMDHTTERDHQQVISEYVTSNTLPADLQNREAAITNTIVNPPEPEFTTTTTDKDIATDNRPAMTAVDPGWMDRRWASHPGFFTPAECLALESLLSDQPTSALVGANGAGRIRTDLRRTDIAWINLDDSTRWVFDRLWDAVGAANREFFHYDIQHLEALQYSIYRAEDQGFYCPHYDWGPSEQGLRKISFTVQLSDPREYAGGELLLHVGETSPSVAPKEQGSITVFPSWMYHEVTPVTQGVRRALVGWFEGPAYF